MWAHRLWLKIDLDISESVTNNRVRVCDCAFDFSRASSGQRSQTCRIPVSKISISKRFYWFTVFSILVSRSCIVVRATKNCLFRISEFARKACPGGGRSPGRPPLLPIAHLTALRRIPDDSGRYYSKMLDVVITTCATAAYNCIVLQCASLDHTKL